MSKEVKVNITKSHQHLISHLYDCLDGGSGRGVEAWGNDTKGLHEAVSRILGDHVKALKETPKEQNIVKNNIVRFTDSDGEHYGVVKKIDKSDGTFHVMFGDGETGWFDSDRLTVMPG